MAIPKHNYRNCLHWLLKGTMCKQCSESAAFVELDRQEAGKQVSELSHQLRNEIYRAVIGICERAEVAKLIMGNGHHMAQKMGESARTDLLERHAMSNEKVAS
jgi:hypothetical protein